MSLDSQETHCRSVRVSRASRQQQERQQVRPGSDPDLPVQPQAFAGQQLPDPGLQLCQVEPVESPGPPGSHLSPPSSRCASIALR